LGFLYNLRVRLISLIIVTLNIAIPAHAQWSLEITYPGEAKKGVSLNSGKKTIKLKDSIWGCEISKVKKQDDLKEWDYQYRTLSCVSGNEAFSATARALFPNESTAQRDQISKAVNANAGVLLYLTDDVRKTKRVHAVELKWKGPQ